MTCAMPPTEIGCIAIGSCAATFGPNADDSRVRSDVMCPGRCTSGSSSPEANNSMKEPAIETEGNYCANTEMVLVGDWCVAVYGSAFVLDGAGLFR